MCDASQLYYHLRSMFCSVPVLDIDESQEQTGLKCDAEKKSLAIALFSLLYKYLILKHVIT